jgi:hypothetical protein
MPSPVGFGQIWASVETDALWSNTYTNVSRWFSGTMLAHGSLAKIAGSREM